MKGGRFIGLTLSAAGHGLLVLLLVNQLSTEPEMVEAAPLLPLDLSMYEPPKAEPLPQPSLLKPVEEPKPEPPPPVEKAKPDKHEDRPKPKPENKTKPKPKKDEKQPPEKNIVEKRLPKPEPDLRKLRQQEWERKRLEEQRRREQQRIAGQRQRQLDQERHQAEQQRLANQQRQQDQASAAATASPPVITNPRFSSTPRTPEYPRRALQRGVEGTAIIRANVSANGQVRAVKVHQSSGDMSLDRAAINAVRGWKFVPASRNGRNIDSIVQVPVKFKIR